MRESIENAEQLFRELGTGRLADYEHDYEHEQEHEHEHDAPRTSHCP
jgi:hypothetical protein